MCSVDDSAYVVSCSPHVEQALQLSMADVINKVTKPLRVRQPCKETVTDRHVLRHLDQIGEVCTIAFEEG